MADQWNGRRPPEDENTFRQSSLKTDRQANRQYGNGQNGGRQKQKNNSLMIFGIVALSAILLAAVGMILYFSMQDRCALPEPVSPQVTERPRDDAETWDPGTNPPTEPPTNPPAKPAEITDPPTNPPTEPPTPVPTSPVRKNDKAVTSASQLSRYDVVTFGRYRQGALGSEMPIEWYVINIDGNRVHLISKYCLDSVRFHEKNRTVSFRDSDLYRWLNGAFKDDAFDAEERSMLSGDVTLLNRKEAMSLLQQEYRTATGTEYAISQGYNEKNSLWWLGEYSNKYTYSDGTSACCAYCIDGSGEAVEYRVDFSGKGVRPVIIIEF